MLATLKWSDVVQNSLLNCAWLDHTGVALEINLPAVFIMTAEVTEKSDWSKFHGRDLDSFWRFAVTNSMTGQCYYGYIVQRFVHTKLGTIKSCIKYGISDIKQSKRARDAF
jgi:hypothetical protein